MDFRLSNDQVALRDGIRSFCDGQLPPEKLGALAAAGGFDRALWNGVAEMGVFGLRALKSEAIATPLDPLTPLHRVLDLLAGERLGGADLALRLRLEGAALTAALSLGVVE